MAGKIRLERGNRPGAERTDEARQSSGQYSVEIESGSHRTRPQHRQLQLLEDAGRSRSLAGKVASPPRDLPGPRSHKSARLGASHPEAAIGAEPLREADAEIPRIEVAGRIDRRSDDRHPRLAGRQPVAQQRLPPRSLPAHQTARCTTFGRKHIEQRADTNGSCAAASVSSSLRPTPQDGLGRPS